MQKFSIYIKSNKFYWSTNKIIYSIVFVCCGIMLFKEKVLKLEKNFIDEIFIWLTLGTLLSGLITKLIGFTKVEKLRGTLEGYLSFEMESITINDEIFFLENIRSVKISNDDYCGKLIHTSKGNFGPALSNGTNNFITIFFESGKPKRTQFRINNPSDFQKIKPELINLYHTGKIDFDELSIILGQKGRQKIEALRIEVQKK